VTATADAARDLMQTGATVSGRNLHTPNGFAVALFMAAEAGCATQVKILTLMIL
jgi:hypothetical protein